MSDPGFEPGVGPNARITQPPATAKVDDPPGTKTLLVHDEVYISLEVGSNDETYEVGQVYLNDDYCASWVDGHIYDVSTDAWESDSERTLEASPHLENWIDFPRTISKIISDSNPATDPAAAVLDEIVYALHTLGIYPFSSKE